MRVQVKFLRKRIRFLNVQKHFLHKPKLIRKIYTLFIEKRFAVKSKNIQPFEYDSAERFMLLVISFIFMGCGKNVSPLKNLAGYSGFVD